MDVEDIIYAAGFFDGEGYITIKRRKNYRTGGCFLYPLMVGISQVKPEVLHWLRSNWGGAVIQTAKPQPEKNRRGAFQWQAQSNTAIRFLVALQPYVKVKQPQLELALQFWRERGDGRRGAHKTPPDIHAKRESFYQQMRHLNQRGYNIASVMNSIV